MLILLGTGLTDGLIVSLALLLLTTFGGLIALIVKTRSERPNLNAETENLEAEKNKFQAEYVNIITQAAQAASDGAMKRVMEALQVTERERDRFERDLSHARLEIDSMRERLAILEIIMDENRKLRDRLGLIGK